MSAPVKISCFTAIFFNLIHNFVAQATETCAIDRHIYNSGFHRNLVTDVAFPGLQIPDVYDCDILLIESFPASVYVDVHQLDFQRIGDDFNYKVHSTQEAAVESPFHKALPQEIYQWGKFNASTRSLKAHLVLPVHLRYHEAQEEDATTAAEIVSPKVLVRCDAGMHIFNHIPGDEVYSSCNNVDLEYLCEWKEVDCDAKDPIEVNIPVGQREHYEKVLLGTVALCGFYTLALLLVALKQEEQTVSEDAPPRYRRLRPECQ